MPFRIDSLAMFAILLGIGSQSRAFAQDDASWKDRFQAEAPPAWEKYRTRAKRFQGSLERTTVRLPNREVVDRDRCEIKQRDGCALFLAQDLEGGDPPNHKGLVLGINSRYGFELSRQTLTAPWTVANLGTDLSQGMTFRFASPPTEAVVQWTTFPTTLAMIPYFPMVGIEGPGFTLKRVTPTTRNDGQVKVEFAYRPPTDKPRIPSIKNGWVLYDPQRSWTIREYNVQAVWAEKVVASVVVAYEYKEAADGFPIPQRVIRRMTPIGGVDAERRYEFDLEEADVPESDFTLSAFGLPEPTGVERPTRWYLWAAVLGFGCLGLAVVLRWRARRAERGTANRSTP